jgi:hypothetical protein
LHVNNSNQLFSKLLHGRKIKDGQQLGRPKFIFWTPKIMSSDNSAKKKLPRTVDDLLSFEDRLQKLQGIFRDIRNGMRENDMPTIDLAIGTFEHYLNLMEPLAEKYLGEFRSQFAVLSAQRTREKIKAEREKRTK